MVTRRTLLAAAGAAVAGSASTTDPAHAASTIGVDPDAGQGTGEGWGTSLAWWANVFGDRDDFADSPMWWMCADHDPSGAANGGTDLQSRNHRRHAHHLAVTTRWSTATPGSGNRYTRRQDLRVSGKQLRVPFTQAQVQTIRMDGVAA